MALLTAEEAGALIVIAVLVIVVAFLAGAVAGLVAEGYHFVTEVVF